MSMTVKMLRKYKNEVFIETGSKEGCCAISAVTICGFKEAHTIEINREYYDTCCSKFEKYPNIHPYLGDSARKVSFESQWYPEIERNDILVIQDASTLK